MIGAAVLFSYSYRWWSRLTDDAYVMICEDYFVAVFTGLECLIAVMSDPRNTLDCYEKHDKARHEKLACSDLTVKLVSLQASGHCQDAHNYRVILLWSAKQQQLRILHKHKLCGRREVVASRAVSDRTVGYVIESERVCLCV